MLPRLVEMETKYGSLTRGMLAAHKRMRAQAKNSSKTQNGGASPAIFTALRGGMSQLVDALVARIDPASLRTRTPVSAIRKTGRLERGGGRDAGRIWRPHHGCASMGGR